MSGLGQCVYGDGRAEGRAEGRLEGEQRLERLNRLNSILIADKRYEDLKRSTEDKEFQSKLLDELVPETE